jgi:hypothetical protein
VQASAQVPPAADTRAGRLLTTVPLAAVGAFLLWCLLHPRYEGDTIAVVHGADAARACLADGPLTNCPGVSYFPLFQYLPAAALGALGAGDTTILRVLAAISTLCCAAIILLAWRIVRRWAGAAAAAVVVIALAAGPLIWYARSSFGELLAAFLMLLFAEAVLSRRGAFAIAATLWLATITKETAVPFLLVLGLLVLFARGRVRMRAVRPELAGLLAGALLGFATNCLFNVFRYDSVWNEYNVQSIFRVPGYGRRAQIAVAIWTAPNGGLLEFWPLAVLLGALGLAWALARGRAAGVPRWPALVLLAVLAWLTAGFASWYSPFGWYAWGPRLELVWIPLLLVLATVLYPQAARSVAAWVGTSGARRLAAGLVVALAALPHVGALQPPDPLPRLFATDAACPTVPVVQTSPPDYYYSCFHHIAWGKSPVLIDAVKHLGGAAGVTFVLLLALSALAALLGAPLTGRPRNVAA